MDAVNLQGVWLNFPDLNVVPQQGHGAGAGGWIPQMMHLLMQQRDHPPVVRRQLEQVFIGKTITKILMDFAKKAEAKRAQVFRQNNAYAILLAE